MREHGKQRLGTEFYSKEGTLIFQNQKILTLSNIYNYQTCLEVLKILKFRRPHSLYETYQLSQRNTSNLLILPIAKDFTHTSSKMWNIAVKSLAKEIDLVEIKPGAFKRRLKNKLLEIQGKHDDKAWYPSNFTLDSINK